MLSCEESKKNTKRLDQLTVVITRPRPSADQLIKRFRVLGAQTIHFPSFQILASSNPLARQLLEEMPAHAWLIFTSQHAVEQAVIHWLPKPGQQVIAIGKTTQRCLESQGIQVNVCAPPPYRSESLLSLPEFQHLNGKKIYLLSGEEGRDLLRASLIARGGKVKKLELYSRQASGLKLNPATWQEWQTNQYLLIVTMSYESLSFLWQATAPTVLSELAHTPLCLLSVRQAKLARQLGHKGEVLVARNASEDAVVSAVCDWFEKKF
jgi:uroporphyrinogen-III synthase